MKYISFIPLIGGMAIANQQATGKKPEYILSYAPFQKNEAHLKEYWPDVEWHLLDAETNMPSVDLDYSDIDFVSSVCPCAGMSSMNMNHSADSETNNWLYRSSEYILGTIKPKVYFGENAPGLYSDVNIKVLNRLREYGRQYGYAFTIYKTDTRLHGIPQRRVRTFFFFWKGDHCPMMEYYNTPCELYENFILDKNHGSHSELPSTTPDSYGAFKWILDDICNGDYSEYVKFIYRCHDEGRRVISPYDYIVFYNKWEDYIRWLDESGMGDVKLSANSKHTHRTVAEYRWNKIKDGKNYYSLEPVMFKGYASAITGKNVELALHPTEKRFLTKREAMSMMGLPSDFSLVSDNIIHITQNVPVCTAKDMTEQVIKFCNGELPMTEHSYIKQNNLTQKIDHKE